MASNSYTQSRLRRENAQFAHTSGLSGTINKKSRNTPRNTPDKTFGQGQNPPERSFVPAFRNDATGEVALSRLHDGRVAPLHLLINLPEAWATAHNARGQISAVLDCVIAGFVRDGQFFTRAEAAACSDR